MKKPWVLSYPLSAQRRLIRLGAHSFCCFCHVAAHILWMLTLFKLTTEISGKGLESCEESYFWLFTWVNSVGLIAKSLNDQRHKRCMNRLCIDVNQRCLEGRTSRFFPNYNTWTASSEFGTYRLCEQRRFRRACASAQSRQNLRCSLMQAVRQEEPSDRKPSDKKPDP